MKRTEDGGGLLLPSRMILETGRDHNDSALRGMCDSLFSEIILNFNTIDVFEFKVSRTFANKSLRTIFRLFFTCVGCQYHFLTSFRFGHVVDFESNGVFIDHVHNIFRIEIALAGHRVIHLSP